jgi:FkbM family methyltransferase
VTDFNTLTQGRYGPMLVNRHDAYVGRSFLAYGEFSEHEVAFLRQYVPEGGVVLDIGANIGALTIPLAQHVGATGRVIAFEPQRFVHQVLTANVALHSLTNVEVVRAGVGAQAGALHVPVLDPNAPNNFGGLELNKGTPGEGVPCVRVDDLRLSRLDVLKADVEGMEADVLRGAMATIARHKPVLYLESDRVAQRGELFDLVEGLGYTAWWHCPPLYSPDNHAGNAENVFGEIVSVNWVCVHIDRWTGSPEAHGTALREVTREEVGG